MHLTATNGHLKIAELPIQRGASVDVLHQAVKNGEVAVASLLINHGANPHSADSNGCTPLHIASHSGHLGVVKLLLNRGADVNALNKANKTAAELASENDKAEVARLIAEYKADANFRNKIRSTTLDTAQYGGDEDGNDEATASLHAAAEEGNIDVVKSLLERGADINDRNANDETPLARAAAKGSPPGRAPETAKAEDGRFEGSGSRHF